MAPAPLVSRLAAAASPNVQLRSSQLIIGLLILLTLVGCKSGGDGPTGPGEEMPPLPVASLEALSAVEQNGIEVGSEIRLRVRARAADGTSVQGASLTLTVTNGSGSVASTASTNAAGEIDVPWRVGTQVGTNSLVVSATSVSPLTFTALTRPGPPAMVQPLTPLVDQTGPAGTTLATAFFVVVRDRYDNPVADVPVSWQVIEGGGTTFGALTQTLGNGVVALEAWRLGPVAGTNRLQVSVNGTDASHVFQANSFAAVSSFDIDLRYESPGDFTPGQRAAIEAAVTKLRSFITVALPQVTFPSMELPCHEVTIPAQPRTVFTNAIVYVYARNFAAETHPSFQPSTRVAIGGSCLYRIQNGNPRYRTTLFGRVHFNTQYLAALDATGALERVAVHELLHALNFGPGWNADEAAGTNDLLQGRGTAQPVFTGTQASVQYGLLPNNTPGTRPVPVDPPSNGHWHSGFFPFEAMIPATSIASYVSPVTVGSLADLGYVVNLQRADRYELVSTGGAAAMNAAPDVLRLRAAPLQGASWEADILAPTHAVELLTNRLIPINR